MQKPQVFRMAMPVDISPGTQEQMRDEGWMMDPYGKNTPPDTGITKLRKIDPSVDLSLPKIYRVRKKDIRTIDGTEYLVLAVEPPKDYKRITKATSQRVLDRLVLNPDGKGGHFPGIVKAVNLSTGDIEEFDAEPVLDQLEQQTKVIGEETRQRVNKEIQAYNERLENIDAAAADLTRIPLQLTRVKEAVDQRISDLDGIILHTDSELQQAKQGPPQGISQMETEIEENIFGGNLNEKNMIDHIFSHYIFQYDQLVSDLEDQESKAYQALSQLGGEQLVEKVKSMGQTSFDSYTEKKSKKKKPSDKEPFDISQFPAIEMQEMPDGSIPVSNKATGYSNWGAYITSMESIIRTSNKDRKSLLAISDSLRDTSQWIGSLPSGTRGMKFLKGTPEGQETVSKLKELANDKIGNFSSRYKQDLVDDGGRLDTAKMGRGGQLGNSLLIPAFARIYSVISKLLENAGISIKEPVQEPVQEPEDASLDPSQINELVDGAMPGQENASFNFGSSTRKKTIKLSKSQWRRIGKQAGWINGENK